jgi:hypothetical protein
MLKNNSKRQISLLWANHKNGDLTDGKIDYYIREDNIIRPDSTYTLIELGGVNAWHDLIKEGNDKKLHIFVFEIDTLRKYKGNMSMNDLCVTHKYLKELEFSETDIIKKNWKLEFDYNN